MSDFKNLLDNFKNARVALVGDIMLDRFIYGDVTRISPEGPVPVLRVRGEEEMLGGAGNVFANLAALDTRVSLFTVVGQDDIGDKIAGIIRDLGGDDSGLVREESWPSTLKSRFIAQNQQLLRVDHEKTYNLSKATQNLLYKKISDLLDNMDVLVLSDYGKGLLTPDFVRNLIDLAQEKNVPVLVDPKQKDFGCYRGATIVTPNKKELAEASGKTSLQLDGEVEEAARVLLDAHDIGAIIATRSADGISVIPKDGEATHHRTPSIEVYDVSGAGDTVVAVVASVIASGGSLADAAKLANKAGAIVVSKLGTATVTREELRHSLDQSDQGGKLGAISAEETQALIRRWQAKGLKVGFTNGCFDILHHGHVNYLANAKEKCDRLVVGLNHDASVRLLKGPSRPINDQDARASVMAALSSVDAVVFFGAEEEGQDNTPAPLLEILKPDLLMKGGDYTVDQLPEAKVVLFYGGQVEIMPLYEGYSTTNIIRKSAGSQSD
jgi:D-beta-D-heptose 7-phosphate kinase/D-beta-D-heptose 1-phosphate adenosyltransferase